MTIFDFADHHPFWFVCSLFPIAWAVAFVATCIAYLCVVAGSGVRTMHRAFRGETGQ